jgi:hypothetical protein
MFHKCFNTGCASSLKAVPPVWPQSFALWHWKPQRDDARRSRLCTLRNQIVHNHEQPLQVWRSSHTPQKHIPTLYITADELTDTHTHICWYHSTLPPHSLVRTLSQATQHKLHQTTNWHNYAHDPWPSPNYLLWVAAYTTAVSLFVRRHKTLVHPSHAFLGLAKTIYISYAIHTLYIIRYIWQGNHKIYGHIRCILANPTHFCKL